MNSGFLDSGGRNNNHKKKKTNEWVRVGLNATGSTINDVNSQTTSPNQNDDDQVADVPNGADYNVWLPLASVHEVNDLCASQCPWMINGIPIFLNKWSPSVSLLKEELSHVPVLVKFHEVLSVAYISDGLNLIATKIGTPVMLDSYMNSMCLESLRRSIYARILVETNACNEFSDHMVMAVLNLEGNDYTKETIRIEYKWEPLRCSPCLIFGHSSVDCTSSPKMTPFVDTNKASTSGYNKEPPSNKGNTFSLSNSFDALNDENLIIEEVSTGSMTTTLGTQNEGQGNDDEVEPVENEMASFLASKPMSVGYGPKSLLEQWRESNVDDDYDHMMMI
ncbi:RNA-directed DNA polymerase, eukaryota, reverse transcriptase zinc-binding domain protein, partial [Tanacetum coccineum]